MDHFYQDVDGWFYHEELFRSLISDLPDDAEIVEVGSWKGKSAAFIGVELINQGRGLRLTCVDTWQGSDEEEHHKDEDVKAGRLFEVFTANTQGVAEVITAMREESPFAAQFFPDMSIDLLYLDAAHDYESVKADIAAWWPKLKPGAFMVGDDFAWPEVAQAVRESFGDYFGTYGDYPAWVARKGAEHPATDSAEADDSKEPAQEGAGKAEGQRK